MNCMYESDVDVRMNGKLYFLIIHNHITGMMISVPYWYVVNEINYLLLSLHEN